MNKAVLLGAMIGGPAGAIGAHQISKANEKGKTMGMPGSLCHILTNNKIDNKNATISEMMKEGAKDVATLGGITLGSAAAASLAVKKSTKAADLLKDIISGIGEKLSKVTVNGENLKKIIKNNKLYTKFNNLPLPAKAAAIAGGAALALFTPIISLTSVQKQGYIEGKHELNPHIDLQSVAKECKKGCVA